MMHLQTQISIIVPVYNVEQYLERCLDSLIKQTLKEIEIICVEDVSSDNSSEILKRYAKLDSRIKLIFNQDNKGLSTCRNLGIDAASSPYIMFCDSDDQYELTMCEDMLTAIEKNNADVAVCGVNIIYENHGNCITSDSKYFSNNNLNGTYLVNANIINKVTNVVAWNKIYKTELLKQYKIYFPDGLLFESYPFWGEYISIAKKITFLSSKLYIYTRRAGSIMSSTVLKKNNHAIDYVKSCLCFYEWLVKNNLWHSRQWHFWQMFVFCTSAALSYAPSEQVFNDIYSLTDNFLANNKITCQLGFNTSRGLSLIKKHQFKEYKHKEYFQFLGIKPINVTHSISNSLYYLFNIPVWEIKYGVTKTTWKLFKFLKLFKIAHKSNCVKYYVLNIPLVKIKQKTTYKKVLLFGFIPVWRQYNNFRGASVNLLRLLFCWLPFPIVKKQLINYLLQKKCHPTLNDCNFRGFELNDAPILQELKKLGHFTYIGNPGNLGDCLIAKATYDFFDKYNLDFEIFKGKPAKTIVYGGGGIWVKNLYAKTYNKFLEIMQQADCVVILPSSIYDCPDLINILDEKFVVFCREKQSYDYLCAQQTKAKIILDHDMALRATVKILREEIIITPERKSLLQRMSPILRRIPKSARLLRNDIEKSNTYQTHYDLSNAFGSRTMSKNDVNFAAQMMLSVVDLYESIITDRLHVAIAASLMGKEVYMLDNSYHKLSMVYQNSLANQKNIHLCSKFPTDIQSGSKATDNFNTLLEVI